MGTNVSLDAGHAASGMGTLIFYALIAYIVWNTYRSSSFASVGSLNNGLNEININSNGNWKPLTDQELNILRSGR